LALVEREEVDESSIRRQLTLIEAAVRQKSQPE
jgi:hypothetical protein